MGYARLYKTEGIILKRHNIGECDRLLTIFTKHYGKIRVVAPGIRKITSRRAGHLELFCKTSLTIHKGHVMDVVTEAQRQEDSVYFGDHLEKIHFAYYAAELVDRLTADRQEQTDIYEQLCHVLRYIQDGEDDGKRQSAITSFALELLWSLGFLPRSITVPINKLDTYIERVIERKLRSTFLLTKLRTFDYDRLSYAMISRA